MSSDLLATRAARRLRRLGLVLAVALVATAGVAAAAEEETWHAETLTTSPRGLNVTQYWSKGHSLMRAETVVAGHRLVTIVNGKRYYSIDATEGQVVSIERSARALAEDKKRKRMIGLEGFVIRERGGEKVKSEVLAGRECDVYSNTDASGRQQVWIQQDGSGDQLPMRVEVYSRQAAATIRTDYVQWAQGLPLPDRFFEPDPRFSVESLTYDEYVARSSSSNPPAVPVLHANLLHGEK
ncbi:MAG TPA: hypothetical protein VKB65_04400 [Myxococcota bacterium]|nr:hypothetical protein [Myxococcota bacterium]